MTNILFLDTETTGFPRKGVEAEEQPRIVELAAMLYQVDEEQAKCRGSISLIIDNEMEIPEKTSEIHGITTEIAESYGHNASDVFGILGLMLLKADLIVAHNIEFDIKLLGYLIERLGFDPSHYLQRETFCTMKASAPIVNLPPSSKMLAAGFSKPKPPKLNEAYKFFFDRELENAHSAIADVMACRDIYFKIRGISHVQP